MKRMENTGPFLLSTNDIAVNVSSHK